MTTICKLAKRYATDLKLIAAGLFVAFNMYLSGALSGGAYGSHAYLHASVMFGGMYILLLIAMIPVCVVLLLSKKNRAVAIRSLIISLAVVPISIPAARAGEEVRMSGFRRLAERSEPLIAAIRSYEADHGMPPGTLEMLVPKYLPEVPTTGIRMHPDYTLITDPEEINYYRPNSWVLRVNASFGMVFDDFLYFSNQNYPEKIRSEPTERIGDWVYVFD